MRAVYDAMDVGNYKLAHKTLKAMLVNKKRPLVMDALMALVLLKLDKPEESVVFRKAVESHPAPDESVLYAMNAVYKLTGEPLANARFHEKVVQVDKAPSESMLLTLFFAYVRAFEWENLKRTALQLCSQYGRAKYACWVVLTMFLQGRFEPSPLALTMTGKMIDKFFKEFELASFSAGSLCCFALILKELNRQQDLLNVLETLKTLHPGSFNAIQGDSLVIEALDALESWDSLLAHIERILSNVDVDSWALVYALIKASCAIQEFEKAEKILASSSSRMFRLGKLLLTRNESEFTAFFRDYGSSPSVLDDVYAVKESMALNPEQIKTLEDDTLMKSVNKQILLLMSDALYREDCKNSLTQLCLQTPKSEIDWEEACAYLCELYASDASVNAWAAVVLFRHCLSQSQVQVSTSLLLCRFLNHPQVGKLFEVLGK